MLLYTVDLEMEAVIRDDYLAWLREHAREMLGLPGFLAAEIYERQDPALPADRRGLVVHYQLRDCAVFEAYLAEHAARMREAGLQRWGERVRACRGLLQTLE